MRELIYAYFGKKRFREFLPFWKNNLSLRVCESIYISLNWLFFRQKPFLELPLLVCSHLEIPIFGELLQHVLNTWCLNCMPYILSLKVVCLDRKPVVKFKQSFATMLFFHELVSEKSKNSTDFQASIRTVQISAE